MTGRGQRVALGAITACVAAAILYPLLRIGQSLLSTEPDPALVIWSEHAGYFWRAWTAAYIGGMVGFVGYLAAGRDPARIARLLARGVVAAAVLLTLQSLLVP